MGDTCHFDRHCISRTISGLHVFNYKGQDISTFRQGNLLKGIDNKNVRTEGIEPIKRVCTYFLFSLIYFITLPTAEILKGKNTRAWVSMVLYLKK